MIQHFYLKPKERRQHAEHKELIATIKESMAPITKLAEENEEEIVILKEETENHEDRIYILERNVDGVKKEMKYVEKYVGGNS